MIYLDCWALSLIVNAKWCSFPEGVPWVRYRGVYKDLNINLIWPGKDSTLGRYLILVCVFVSVSVLNYVFLKFFSNNFPKLACLGSMLSSSLSYMGSSSNSTSCP